MTAWYTSNPLLLPQEFREHGKESGAGAEADEDEMADMIENVGGGKCGTSHVLLGRIENVSRHGA